MTVTDASAALPAPLPQRALADALDALQDGFFVLDRRWRFVFANRTAALNTGLQPSELLGQVIWDRFPSLLGTAIEAGYRRVMAERVPLSLEVKGTLSDRWYRVAVSPADPGISVLWSEVTEHRRTDDALRESEQRYARFAASVPGAICSFQLRPDGTSCMPFAAEALDDLYGVPREVLARDMGPCFANVHPEDVPALRASIAESARTMTPWHAEFRYRHPAKGPCWIEGWSIPSAQPDGSTVWHGYVTDVTARRQAEERDRAAAARDAFRLRLSDALRSLADPGDIRATASRLLANFLGADRVVYGEVRGDLLVVTDDYHGAGTASVAGRHRMSDNVPALLAGLQTGRTVVVRDVDAAPLGDAERAGYAGISVRSHVAVPLRKGGRLAACLAAATSAPRAWTDEEVALVEEVAERTWTAVERAQAEAALRAAGRRKDEFLAVLSHELRNPLAPIRNSIYLLGRAAPGSEQARRAMDVLRRQTDHVTRLVDDLLDVTRISRGKVTLRRERLDLRDVVRKTADDLQSLFDESGVELRVEHPGKPIWVDADRTRVAQVIGNLLQNSVKFTPPGGHVAVTVAAHDGTAQLRVRDDGLGIEPAQIERMFAPFAQADQGIARTKGGLGLGLALVKGLVELHGGSVSARSDGLGRGAEFTVSLPLTPPDAPADEGPASTHPEGARDVLVIEDNADAAETLADVLTLLGHRVRLAANGRSGLALARDARPDVILCDIGLPDLSGYEVARAVRAEASLAGTRLVALTGYAQPEDRQRALEAGFDAHAAKPLATDALARLISG